jgi:hypothetical protein
VAVWNEHRWKARGPGFNEADIAEANSELGQNRYMRMRNGSQPLPGPDEYNPAWDWWASRTRCFDDDWERVRSKVAVLNIGAYHSRAFRNDPLLAARSAIPCEGACGDSRSKAHGAPIKT